VVGRRVGLGVDVELVGDGSRQTNPNQALEVQVCELVALEDEDRVVDEGEGEVLVGSLQPPNQPGSQHELVDVGTDIVVVTVGAGEALGVLTVLEAEVVVESKQPNHPKESNKWLAHILKSETGLNWVPGVKQVVLDVEFDDVVVVDPVVVVVSSRQPHHPADS
jgi:hypothetical protein